MLTFASVESNASKFSHTIVDTNPMCQPFFQVTFLDCRLQMKFSAESISYCRTLRSFGIVAKFAAVSCLVTFPMRACVYLMPVLNGTDSTSRSMLPAVSL